MIIIGKISFAPSAKKIIAGNYPPHLMEISTFIVFDGNRTKDNLSTNFKISLEKIQNFLFPYVADIERYTQSITGIGKSITSENAPLLFEVEYVFYDDNPDLCDEFGIELSDRERFRSYRAESMPIDNTFIEAIRTNNLSQINRLSENIKTIFSFRNSFMHDKPNGNYLEEATRESFKSVYLTDTEKAILKDFN